MPRFNVVKINEQAALEVKEDRVTRLSDGRRQVFVEEDGRTIPVWMSDYKCRLEEFWPECPEDQKDLMIYPIFERFLRPHTEAAISDDTIINTKKRWVSQAQKQILTKYEKEGAKDVAVGEALKSVGRVFNHLGGKLEKKFGKDAIINNLMQMAFEAVSAKYLDPENIEDKIEELIGFEI